MIAHRVAAVLLAVATLVGIGAASATPSAATRPVPVGAVSPTPQATDRVSDATSFGTYRLHLASTTQSSLQVWQYGREWGFEKPLGRGAGVDPGGSATFHPRIFGDVILQKVTFMVYSPRSEEQLTVNFERKLAKNPAVVITDNTSDLRLVKSELDRGVLDFSLGE